MRPCRSVFYLSLRHAPTAGARAQSGTDRCISFTLVCSCETLLCFYSCLLADPAAFTAESRFQPCQCALMVENNGF